MKNLSAAVADRAAEEVGRHLGGKPAQAEPDRAELVRRLEAERARAQRELAELHRREQEAVAAGDERRAAAARAELQQRGLVDCRSHEERRLMRQLFQSAPHAELSAFRRELLVAHGETCSQNTRNRPDLAERYAKRAQELVEAAREVDALALAADPLSEVAARRKRLGLKGRPQPSEAE